MKRLIAAVVVMAGMAWADSVPIMAWQNQGNTSVLLTLDSQPVLGPTIRWGSDLLCFSFPVDGDWKAIMTLNGGGYEQAGFVPYGDVFMGFDHLPFFYQGAMGTIQLYEDGHWMDRYKFWLVTPVPEPTTMLMVGSGLALVGWRKRRIRQR